MDAHDEDTPLDNESITLETIFSAVKGRCPGTAARSNHKSSCGETKQSDFKVPNRQVSNVAWFMCFLICMPVTNGTSRLVSDIL